MSDGIQPVHYVPEVRQVSPKERNNGKKDRRKGGQGFSEYIPGGYGDEKNIKNKNSNHNQIVADKDAEGKENSSRTKDLDVDCGTIIDVEV